MFHFIVRLLGANLWKNFLVVIYIYGAICGLLIISTNLLINGTHHYYWGYYPRAGLLHPIFLVIFIGLIVSCVVLLVLTYFRSKTTIVRKKQIKYVLIALFIFDFASLDFIPNYGFPLYPFGYIPTTIMLLIMTYSIVKLRLLDVPIAITRAGIFVAVYSLVLGTPFVIAFIGQTQLKYLIGDDWWLVPLICSTILATGGPFIYLYIQKRAEEKLLKEQKRYQMTLRQASSGMGRIKDIKRLTNLIVHIVTRTVHIEGSAVYLYNPIKKDFNMEAQRNWKKGAENGSIKKDSPLIKYLEEVRYPVVHEEIKQRNQDYQDPQLAQVEVSLRNLDAALVMPSFADDRLLAVIVLGQKRDRQLFSEDDLTVFSVLASQAGLSIENCQFYEEAKKTQEQLFQAEKMATIGTMADGLSHQINNRLHAMGFIAGDALDTIKLKKNNLADPLVKELVESLEHSLDRIQDNVRQGGEVVQGLLKYTRKGDVGLSPVDLDSLITASLDMVKYKIKMDQFVLTRDYPVDLPKIKGNFTQLQEVFFNLIDNAYDAMMQRKAENHDPEFQGRLRITANVRPGHMEIGVLDNGMGVKEKDVEKLFTPFFTTKLSSKKGTGLGLYVIKKIIEENHGGKITLSSEYMVGTLFTIILPILD